MEVITVKNDELALLNRIIAICVAFFSLFLGTLVSFWFFAGFLLVILVIRRSSGVQFDVTNRKYRKFENLGLWTQGQWKELGTTKNFVVLVKHGVKTTYSIDRNDDYQASGYYCELYLMDDRHINRLFVDSSGDHEEIEKLAISLSQRLEVDLKPYQPNI